MEKEAAVEAELRAARERAVVPQETRMNQFKDMLLERGVKPNYSLNTHFARCFIHINTSVVACLGQITFQVIFNEIFHYS